MKNYVATVPRRPKMSGSAAQKRHDLQFGKRFLH